MVIPIFTDEAAQQGGWHGIELRQAFAKRGVETAFIELQSGLMDLSDQHPQVVFSELGSVYVGAFVRGIAAGTLQQVITRLNLLHLLHRQGVYVYNNAKAIERTVDKGMTSYLLREHGVATPPTWVCESRHTAHAILHQHLAQCPCMVIKPLFGSQGKGVRLLHANAPWPLPGDQFVDGVYYLQAFVDSGAHSYDYRVLVVNREPVAAMQRQGDGWLHNVAQGAQVQAIQDQAVLDIAVAAANALDIDYCGVDVIRDAQGQLWVLEVNSIPAWHGLQSVTSFNIAQVLVDDFLGRLDG